MNAEQRKALQVVAVILGCFSIYTYTAIFSPVIHYCDYTGLQIENRIGHEVSFDSHNGSTNYYCCVNVSLLAFQDLKNDDMLGSLDNVQVRCPMCGMLMDWNAPMIVWVYSVDYLNPTTNQPTIVPLCEDEAGVDLCESHFIDEYGGIVIDNPFIWS